MKVIGSKEGCLDVARRAQTIRNKVERINRNTWRR